jgi:hypothetical protein
VLQMPWPYSNALLALSESCGELLRSLRPAGSMIH